jgi:hypothetical protein
VAGVSNANQQIFSRDAINKTALQRITVRQTRKWSGLVTLDQ